MSLNFRQRRELLRKRQQETFKNSDKQPRNPPPPPYPAEAQAMIEIIFIRPLTIYNSSEPINCVLSSKAKPLLSAQLVSSNSFNFDRNVGTQKKVFAPFLFIAFDRQN